MKRSTIGILFLIVTFLLSPSLSAAAADVHTVTSSKIVYFDDDAGNLHSDPALTGTLSMSWKDRTHDGFFNAKIDTGKDIFEVRLISFGKCNSSIADGLFDIYKNGVRVAEGVVGRVYNIGGVVQFNAGTTDCLDHANPVWDFVFKELYQFDA
ncbi:MAG: hypothetical protein GY940_23635 [bacterium]|nr:hypothetical protein [bacterium]